MYNLNMKFTLINKVPWLKGEKIRGYWGKWRKEKFKFSTLI